MSAMPCSSRKVFGAFFSLALILVVFSSPAFATSSCSVTVNRHNDAPAGSESGFTFTITNSGPSTIQWVKITKPDQNASVTYANSNTWSATNDTNQATFTSGTLSPATSWDFQVNIFINDAFNSNWIVQTSDDPGGLNPVSCSGDLSISVADYIPPLLSPALVQINSSSEVTIFWTTDEPTTSQIQYGTTPSYGQSTTLDNNLVLNHQVAISGLSPNTSYHYQFQSSDASGNSASSSDNTFVTPTTPPVVTPAAPTQPSAQAPTSTKDNSPPQISITSNFHNPVNTIPTFSGTATDNTSVTKVEYSSDVGVDWLPAQATGLGQKKVSFSFTPAQLEDGKYSILARAIDGSGNNTNSNSYDLIIDRLPPIVGANIISTGPYILTPSSNGPINITTGVDLKVTTSAVGGPNKITLSTTTSSKEEKTFSLVRSTSGLWSGVISFETAGVYPLTVNSEDDAGNKLTRKTTTINVLPPGSFTDSSTHQAVSRAKVVVHSFNPQSSNWQIWDAASFGQLNPQSSNKDGQFSLLLPPGKYYLETTAQGYKTTFSQAFDITEPTPILSKITLSKTWGIHLGPINLDLPLTDEVTISLGLSSSLQSKDVLVDKLDGLETPSFSLTNSSGQTTTDVDLLGKPSILTFINTWSPDFSQQLQILASLQKNNEINVIPIVPLEPLQNVASTLETGGYDLNVLVDNTGVTISKFKIQSEPTHFFVTRKGIIKESIVGVLSIGELESHLVGL